MSSDSEDSSGAESGETKQRPDLLDAFNPDFLEGHERLVVPSNLDTMSLIPFGIDGTSVLISPFGEIVSMSQYFAEENSRILCLDCRDFFWWRKVTMVRDRPWLFEPFPGTGATIHIKPISKMKRSRLDLPFDLVINKRLEWVNGRWPCIHYEVDGIVVSILFTVQAGVLLQQFVLTNASQEDKKVHFRLDIEELVVNTLHVKGHRWTLDNDRNGRVNILGFEHNADTSFNKSEAEQVKTRDYSQRATKDEEKPIRDEALVSVFLNDTLLKFDDAVFTSEDSDDEVNEELYENGKGNRLVSSGVLSIPSKGLQKLVVQYKLRYRSDESCIPDNLGTDAFLRKDQVWNWAFKQEHKFNAIFRRHLEHILCLCLVKSTPNKDQHLRTPFITDPTFRIGSTPVGDFYIFRYLLFMYQLLKPDDHVRSAGIPPSQATQVTDTVAFDKCSLLARIKEACKGHLRWCFFEPDVFLAPQSWPVPSKPENDPALDGPTNSKAGPFNGSLQILKLFEFVRVFKKEAELVNECLVIGGIRWIRALKDEKDAKSGLWYRDKRTYITWEGRREEGSEWLQIPEYRLGDLIYIWKAIKCLEAMVQESQRDDRNAENIQEISWTLRESKLRHRDVRATVLKRFLSQVPGPRPRKEVDRNEPMLDGKAAGEPDAKASSFVIPVRRSREKDRLLFYSKDTMLHDGMQWGFFENDIEVEATNANNEPVKPEIKLSMENTMRAQGEDQEVIWKKLLHYALAIIMAGYNHSLDNSKSPAELEKVSWERLLDCVLPHGIIPSHIHWDTKQPRFSDLSGYSRSTWEIPTLLLRCRFNNLELDVSEDQPSSPTEHISIPEEFESDANKEPKTAIMASNEIPKETKIKIRKKVALAKQKTSHNKKVDRTQVFDPIDRKVKDWLYPFPDFIGQVPPYNMREVSDNFEKCLARDLNDHLEDSDREKVIKILKRGMNKWRAQGERFALYNYSAVLVDVGQQGPKIRSCDADDLDWDLRQARTASEAKKRFQWVNIPDNSTLWLILGSFLGPLRFEYALILYLASPRTDRHRMARFYIRHSTFSCLLQEDVHPLADVWATELHLSFFQLVDTKENNRGRNSADEEFPIPDDDGNDDVCNGLRGKFPQITKASQYDIYRAALSYRFTGDMGDRFWSGYLLTYLPGKSKVFKSQNDDVLDGVQTWFEGSRRNDQRKILEPFLVEKMSSELYQSTDRILRSIDDWLDPLLDFTGGKDSEINLSKADDRTVNVQYTRSTLCLELDATLRILRRLLKMNVDSLDQWLKREATRHHKPRWSVKDELKYRDLVDYHKRRAGQRILSVKDQYKQVDIAINQVRTHRQELINNINLAESRSAARQSENVRIFTYATVVFYPLSFVAALFSMQGPPDHATASIFLQAIAIALIATLVVVFNAETLAWPIRRFSFSISHTAREKMENTPNIFPVAWEKVIARIKEAEEEDVLHDTEMPKRPRSKLIYLFFLFIYMLVDFPAYRIALACDSMARIDAFSPDRFALAGIRVLIAIFLFPILVAVWIILITWNLLSWSLKKLLITPHKTWLDLRKKTDTKLEHDLKVSLERELEEEEKAKGQERARNMTNRKDTQAKTVEEKNNKKENKKQSTEEEVLRRLKEKRTKEREEKKERLRNNVALLINPPNLYDRDSVKSRKMGGKFSEPLPSRRSDRVSLATTETEEPPEARNQGLSRRRMWPFARRGSGRANEDEV